MFRCPRCAISVSPSTLPYRRSPANLEENAMGRAQSLRQGGLLFWGFFIRHSHLALMEPGPTVSPGMRATLIPLVAALLLEATTGPGSEETDGEARVREAGDEPDHA
jgi:hypothetical protein